MVKVNTVFNAKYSQGPVFDAFEKIIQDYVESDGSFDCNRENISEKIIAVHDVDHNPTLSLWVGPYYKHERTSLKIFCRRISTLIFEGGWKEEVISILFAILLKEMKNRFDKKKGKYSYKGVEGMKEEGVIKLKA
ncbi:hypothetical protein KAR91_78965 [Candidatus Pacearchaeota archaeon]|nr:hypothetical protein [Candidatus Pacearchaeota archaeon]